MIKIIYLTIYLIQNIRSNEIIYSILLSIKYEIRSSRLILYYYQPIKYKLKKKFQ